MKKYFQITFFLGVFGLLLIFRQLKGSNETPIVGVNSFQNQQPTIAPTTNQTSQPTQAPVASSSNTTSAPTATPTPTPAQTAGGYKNGTFTGSTQDAYYGNIQVQAVISGGKIVDVLFLQYPNDNSTSQYINSQALPMLKQEAIQAQSANISGISGASATSPAFIASLTDAINQAK